MIIHKPVEEVFSFWRKLENLPLFMHHLESVTKDEEDERISHWVAKAPLGQKIEWDSEITDEKPNQLLAWQSLPNSQIIHFGQVEFKKGAAGR